ncbi:MAG: hypothetical protein COX29_01930 [Candidatus Moranbacteria bacterium CG23_combo_of_CG06-09_8_20_14_all_35_22]|nr:MAG: hypothetical protein COX29_01930 [Candidatus Moranbacteria bacterium CG23_combo_of_CG06-09_8_20_14_all_35_22]
MSGILAKNILSTVAYYDALDYPMTAFEIWKYLINDQRTMNNNQDGGNKNYSLSDVTSELEKEETKKYLGEFQGFYFLHSRENLVGERIEKNKISQSKLKKARRIVFWLRAVPFVKMIAVAGRVGAKTAKKGSDIDLLIVFQHGKIFTGRFLATALIHFFGRRRYKNKIANRICLNHFLSDEFSVSMQDLYSSHSYVFLTVLYGGKFFRKFLEKNEWLKNYRPNFSFLESDAKEIRESWLFEGIRKILEIFLAPLWIEKKMKNWQTKKIERNPLTEKIGGVIIYSDFELAFWPDFSNQGPKVFEKFQENLEKLNYE